MNFFTSIVWETQIKKIKKKISTLIKIIKPLII